MHQIEPFFRWRHVYSAEQDERSPFFGRAYSEFEFQDSIYNYVIHPQWDNIGSSTLFVKILYTNYEAGFTLIELIGEWNDTVHNDVMELMRTVIEPLMDEDVFRFIFLCENLLNFHGGDDDYYVEWAELMAEQDGWAVLLDTLDHVGQELTDTRLSPYLIYGPEYNEHPWRKMDPEPVFLLVHQLVNSRMKLL